MHQRWICKACKTSELLQFFIYTGYRLLNRQEWKRLKGCDFSPPWVRPVPARGREARKRNSSIASIPTPVHLVHFIGRYTISVGTNEAYIKVISYFILLVRKCWGVLAVLARMTRTKRSPENRNIVPSQGSVEGGGLQCEKFRCHGMSLNKPI